MGQVEIPETGGFEIRPFLPGKHRPAFLLKISYIKKICCFSIYFHFIATEVTAGLNKKTNQ